MITQKLINWVELYDNKGHLKESCTEIRNSIPKELSHIVDKLYDMDTGYPEHMAIDKLYDEVKKLIETSSDVKLILDCKSFEIASILLLDELSIDILESCYKDKVITVDDIFSTKSNIVDRLDDVEQYNFYLKIFRDIDLFDNPLKDSTNKSIISDFSRLFSWETLDYIYVNLLADKRLMLKESIINRFEEYGTYQLSIKQFDRLIDYIKDDIVNVPEDINRIINVIEDDYKFHLTALCLGY